MKKTLWLKITIILLPLLILVQVLSGFLSDALGRAFPLIHITGGLLILLVGIVHASLNWGWISKQIFHQGLGQK